NTVRYAWFVTRSSHSAVSGPAIAPTVSINRSKPNARPYADGDTSAASNAFFAGDLTPRASRDAALPNNTSTARVASPNEAVATAVTTYPITTSGLRRFHRSV